MTYVKDLPPSGAGPGARAAYLDRELVKLEQDSQEQQRLIDALLDALRSGGVNTIYIWDDSVIMADPGVGQLRGNDILLPNVTQFAVSAETQTQTFPPFGLLDAGDRVVLVNESQDVQELYELTGVPANNATWWLFDVNFLQGALNNPLDGALISLIWFPVAEIVP